MARSKRSVDQVLRAALAAVPADEPAGPWLVAWSGGLDSTVLLHALVQQVGAAQVQAVHIHHGLQPEADAWAEHGQRQAQAWGVQYEVLRAPPRPITPHNVEQWARSQRYRLLAEAAQRSMARAVLTAHHADDQLETVLLALARGCGLDGLTGIAPLDTRAGVRVLRPLLELDRRALQEYAQDAGLSWVQDPSNLDITLARNRVRAMAVPALEAALPGLTGQLAHTLEHLRAARQTLDALTTEDLQRARSPDALGQAGWSLHRPTLAALPPTRQAAVLRAWVRAHGALSPTQARMAVWLEQLIAGPHRYAEQALGQARLIRYQDRICWVPHTAASPITTQAWTNVLDQPCMLPHAGIVRAVPVAEGLDAAWLRQQTLTVSPAPASARVRLHPSAPGHTLKNLRQEAGIPRALRAGFPAVWCEGALLWAAPFGLNGLAQWPRARPGLALVWEVGDLRGLWPVGTPSDL